MQLCKNRDSKFNDLINTIFLRFIYVIEYKKNCKA